MTKRFTKSLFAALGLRTVVAAMGLSSADAIAQPAAGDRSLRAGASLTDVTPTEFPVIVNGMFTNRIATSAHDRLHARCLVLASDEEKIAIVVVDSCMMPRDLIDRAKALASGRSGIPMERILISATHTHSAPSAVGALGTDADPKYPAFLEARLAQGIEAAAARLEPARVGWTVVSAPEYTNNRQWILRADKVRLDPFGLATIRSNMHPGYQHPDFVGPSGPVDPALSLLAVQTADGRPIALLANYSMHYFGSPILSADYFGRFCDRLTERLGLKNLSPPFVAMMSQGTSGDLMWMDYGQAEKQPGLDAYADGLAAMAEKGFRTIQYKTDVPVAITQRTLRLGRRTPNPERLAWAQKIVKSLNGRLPQTLPEVYAREQVFLHEDPTRELVLQAVRIGDLGITAIPNEVFALTGLKLKRRSPLETTFNIELANGGEGYIPPPEQHPLGGYTTWPARSAALAPEAETKIVDALLSMLEEIAGKTRKPSPEAESTYSRAVRAAQPVAQYRLGDMDGRAAGNEVDPKNPATLETGVVLYLDGVLFDGKPPKTTESRSVHLAGGRIHAKIPKLNGKLSAELWYWNGRTDGRETVLLALREAFAPVSIGARVVLQEGKLFLVDANDPSKKSAAIDVGPRTWRHTALTQDGGLARLYLDGKIVGEIQVSPPVVSSRTRTGGIPVGPFEGVLDVGGVDAADSRFEGKIDELATYDRALTAEEIAKHFQAGATVDVFTK